jgi:hypothetical protein
MSLAHSAPASRQLLDDLRSDKGMGWVPSRGWLTKVAIDASAPDLRFDLAIDASGYGSPSARDAGLVPFGPLPDGAHGSAAWIPLLALIVTLPLSAALLIGVVARSGKGGRPLAGA